MAGQLSPNTKPTGRAEVRENPWPGDGEADRPDRFAILGIAESGLRRWMAQADIDDGHVDRLSFDERKEHREAAPG